jgi:uncharacterized protein (DUF302 family)
MFKSKYLILSLIFIQTIGLSAEGLIKIKSHNSVNQTVANLKYILNQKGMTIFKVINHKKGAKKVGKNLRPTTVVIFGNPNVGTPLMRCSQTAAIDLPQKALVWKDKSGQVWFGYNNPSYLASRHNIEGCDMVVKKIGNALAKFAKFATKKSKVTTPSEKNEEPNNKI